MKGEVASSARPKRRVVDDLLSRNQHRHRLSDTLVREEWPLGIPDNVGKLRDVESRLSKLGVKTGPAGLPCILNRGEPAVEVDFARLQGRQPSGVIGDEPYEDFFEIGFLPPSQ